MVKKMRHPEIRSGQSGQDDRARAGVDQQIVAACAKAEIVQRHPVQVELKTVAARGEIRDPVATVAGGEHEDIAPRPAGHRIGAPAPLQPVGAPFSVQPIGPLAPLADR